jgi:crotonobetainyl-CoA:carnitine CoA-transferase CaiB-like acyl-CoA transferase
VNPGAYDILSGVRVVEFSSYAYAPAAGAVLAEWGADVVRVVHPHVGDPMLTNPVRGMGDDHGVAYMWEILNRGKRCIGIDVGTGEGSGVLATLVRTADVFLTNALPKARKRLRIDVEDLRCLNGGLVYARASANGPAGPERDAGGFDASSFWARSGLADAAGALSGEHGQPAMAIGDLTSGGFLAAGVVGALFRRERTGEGAVVDSSLLASGIWVHAPSVVASRVYDVPRLPMTSHADARNPLVAIYRTSDGEHLSVASMSGEAGWQDLCSLAGRADLAGDERFSTLERRARNSKACVEALDSVFGTHTLAEWLRALGPTRLPVSAVRRSTEVPDDEQVRINGYVTPAHAGSGVPYLAVATPIQFDETSVQPRPAPLHGQHTEEVLLELGYDWGAITELKESGAVL